MPAPTLLPMQPLAQKVTKLLTREALDIRFNVQLNHQVTLGFDVGEVITPESLKEALAKRLEQVLLDMIDAGGSLMVDVASIDETETA